MPLLCPWGGPTSTENGRREYGARRVIGTKSIRHGVASALIAACLVAAPDAAAIPREFFGISAERPEAAEFEEMAAAGFGSFRVAVDWRRVQAKRNGRYDWSYTDREVVAAEQAGMRPVILVYGTPHFVHDLPPNGVRGIYPPTRRADLDQWRDFTAALARRYGKNGRFDSDPADPGYRPVRTWVIWNEQNTVAYWLPRPDPTQYAQVLKFANAGITRVDPSARIVVGGMFGYPIAHASIKSFAFLRRLYEIDGIKRLFDSVSVHPYATTAGLAITQIKRFRKVMRRANDRRASILVGEIGWPSATHGQAGQARRFASFLHRAINHRREWRIEGVTIYVWRDNPDATSCHWCPHSGLVNSDGSPKHALIKVTSIIRDATNGF